MSRLRLRTFTTCDKTIVSTQGDISLATASVLDAHLAALAKQGKRQVVLNLSRTAYVDSAGLAAMMRAYKALHHEGGALTVVGCQPWVARVLHMVGFQQFFPIHEHQTRRSRREATAA